jgi:hypothetical protein
MSQDEQKHFHIWMPDQRSLCDRKAETVAINPRSEIQDQIHQASVANQTASTADHIRAEAAAAIAAYSQEITHADEIAGELDAWVGRYPWCPACVIVAEMLADHAADLVRTSPNPAVSPDDAVQLLTGTRWGRKAAYFRKRIPDIELSIYPTGEESVR